MNPRERNALIAPLTGSGLRHVSGDRAHPRAVPTVEEEAREMLARFLATLPCYSASELMRRCFPFEYRALGSNRPDGQDD